MKKIVLISFAALLALVSCNKELSMPEEGIKGNVTFKASIVETKTALGPKEGESWPNYWSAGDVISVNGVVSDPIDDSFVGKADAEFYVEGVAAPYNVAYPASAISEYEAGSATVTIPDEQIYVEGSYDPEAYIMLAKASGTTLDFVPQMAIFSITPTGTEGQVKSISLISLGGKKISGAFTTDFESLTAADGAFDSVTLSSNEGIDLGKPWMILIPASDFTEDGIKVIIEDAAGGVMTRTTKPSKAYVAGKMYSAEIPYSPDPLSLTHIAASSSSLVYEWGRGVAYADIASDYSVSLYSDQSCATLVASYDIPANNDCWNGKEPRFSFSGLSAGTTYYCKVIDNTNDLESDPVAATTAAFTIVDPASVTTAAVNDVILAEDFGEICWGGDLPNAAAGFNCVQDQDPINCLEAASFVRGSTSTTELLLGRNAYFSTGVRLLDWAQGKNNLYMHPGYIKLSTNSTNNAHIVTPALNSIPEGMIATLEITITAAGWGSSYKAIAAVQHSNAADLKNLSEASNQTNSISFDNVSEVTLGSEAQTWGTHTITVGGVVKGDRIAIGSTETVEKGKGRFMLSDVVIKVTNLVSAEHESVEISDFATLKAFLASCASLPAANGTVTADITLTDEEEADIAALYPIPVYDATLDGGGFTISGLKKPFINVLKGPVSDLILNSTLNITDAMNNIGILAGSATDADISGCVTNGSVALDCESAISGDLFIAGMVGKISGGTLTNCVNNASVTNTTDAGDSSNGIITLGGLIGNANTVTFVKCVNNGDVTNSGVAGKNDTYCRVGGLVGWADGVNLSASGDNKNINYGAVTEKSTSKDAAFAGVVAYAEGEVSNMSNCRNEGTITLGGDKRYYMFFGGIAGALANASLLDNTYNSGLITASGAALASTGYLRVGGIVGGWFKVACTSQTITGCTNTGAIKMTSDNLGLYSSGTKVDCYIGGIAGGGYNNGVCGKELKNCKNSGNITLNGGSANSGKLYHMFVVGGIIGYTDVNPTGSKCIADIRLRTTKGLNRVGGIAGEMMIEEIHDVTYKGTVNTNGTSGTNNFVGLLVGNVGNGTRTFNKCTVSGISHGGNSTTTGSGIFFSCNGGGTGPTVNIASCTVGSGTSLQTASEGYQITITSADQITAENVCGTNGSTRTCTTGTNDGLSVVVDPDTITL